jgi:hypothetical protein
MAKEQVYCHWIYLYDFCPLLPVRRPALYYHDLSQAALRLKPVWEKVKNIGSVL